MSVFVCSCLLLLLLAADFCNYQPKWSCRFCVHFVGLTTAFFAFYKTIWVGISLASIAVEAVATFSDFGEKNQSRHQNVAFYKPIWVGSFGQTNLGNERTDKLTN